MTLDAGTVARWWPSGYGEQPLHNAELRLEESADQPRSHLDSRTRRLGFRTAAWHTVADEDGTGLQLLVNGQPVYVKGANWIPDDAFFTRADRTRLARRLTQARDAHLNLIRVWGGGLYESDDFYDLCDELGLLTWQDFLFACAGYPEEEPLRGEVEAEARQNIDRLSHHASLVMLCGNNENLWGYEDWGWKQLLDGRTWGAHFYHELLPQLVEELAPHVPYTPGSPFSPGDQHPNDERHGSTHLWKQWNQRDWPTYREHSPRFVAEFGWQGPPAWSTLTRAVSDDPLTPESPGMIVHQKAEHGNDKLSRGLITHHRIPTDMEDWHWAMQLNQAEAVGTALSWFRSLAPLNTGAIVWQLNDCWPVTSWAAIDGDEREKPLYHAMRAAFAPRIVAIQPGPDSPHAVLSNDTGEPWEGELTLRRTDMTAARNAQESAADRRAVEVPARGTVRVPLPPELATAVQKPEAQDPAGALLAEFDGVRGWWFIAEPRDSDLPPAQLSAESTLVDDGVRLTLTADTFTRDLTVLIDKLIPEAQVDRALVTLLPGESVHIHLTPGVTVAEADRAQVVARLQQLELQRLTAPEVLRSRNQLVETGQRCAVQQTPAQVAQR